MNTEPDSAKVPSRLQQIETLAAEAFLINKTPVRIAMTRAAARHPEALALELVFAFMSVQSNLGRMFDTDPKALADLADEVNQACALLAADVYALQMQGETDLTCAAILRHWGPDDPYFSPQV